MANRIVCVAARLAAHTEVLVSYLGTGSTWCTWKKNLERLFHTGTGPKMGMCHLSGRESVPLFNRVQMVNVLVMASPAVIQGIKLTQPD